eukprot:CAMPEP_0174260480 /NCGR_PEP_ID=MMETSP0439-20130205/9737_1 /TAXON_ID=0 /ORGANISM="Stereomyxa ramosa, Strain Chinc5" /LENGTH=514 /DNA_ID=CAMNT_0015344731 /DNA_START=35 /DNA_END=1579 /DNA_ORIENTATION=-
MQQTPGLLKRRLSVSLMACSEEEAEYPAKTKAQIVCTIGPACNTVDQLVQMAHNGMSVACLNLSHGTLESHENLIQNIRKASEISGKTIGIMVDTKGAEIRTGNFAKGSSVPVKAGAFISFIPDPDFLGDSHKVAIDYRNFGRRLKRGTKILIDDGYLSFTVKSITSDGSIKCSVDNSGVLLEHKRIHLHPAPKGLLESLHSSDKTSLTERDLHDVAWAIDMGVDWIAQTGVRNKGDVLSLKELLEGTSIQVIAKIESQEGLDNFDEILEVSDGIMIARGDLGVEIPVFKISIAQKMIIRKCNAVGKPVITATQMMESMVKNPRPTRAEATDVANAVFDGTDCVMLSGETAKGDYPVEVVRFTAKICYQAEGDIDYRDLYWRAREDSSVTHNAISTPETIASSAVKTGWDISAPIIFCFTQSGTTARLMSKYRPEAIIMAVTEDPQVARHLQMIRGVYPFLVGSIKGASEIITSAVDKAKELGFLKAGQPFVFTYGRIEGVGGSTNLLQVGFAN